MVIKLEISSRVHLIVLISNDKIHQSEGIWQAQKGNLPGVSLPDR
jgi:hypothetical protein